MKKYFIYSLSLLLIFVIACSDDDISSEGSYKSPKYTIKELYEGKWEVYEE